jgi:uncharacterized protein involved in cysteine biosynthesis
MSLPQLMKRSARTLVSNPLESALLVALCYLTTLLGSGDYLAVSPSAGLAMSFGGFVVGILVFAFGVALTGALLDGRTENVLGHAVSRVTTRAPSLFGAEVLAILAVIAFTICAFILLIIPLLNLLAFIPVLLAFIGVALVFAFIDVAVVEGEHSAADALPQSYQFVRQNLEVCFGYGLVVLVFALVASAPLLAELFTAAPLEAAETATLPVETVALLSIPSAFVSAYAVCLRTAVYKHYATDAN